MQGIWKSHLGKNSYYKDCKIKNNKYKHMKKDKFSYYNKSYNKLSKNAKKVLTADVCLESNIAEGQYRVNNPHYYNKRLYITSKYYGMLINNPLKKYYKKLSSSKNRRAVKRWIKGSDWDKNVDTHKLSKSIERMCI